MRGTFTITNEIENADGTWTFVLDTDDEFVEWFKEWQGLKRWSQKRFQKVMLQVLTEATEREFANNV